MPTAATAVFGKVAIPEMMEAKTDRRLAAGSVVAAAGLSAIIPPSVIAIIYGFLAIAPIHKILMAGLLPGLLSVGITIAMLGIRLKANPALCPPMEPVPWRERWRLLRGVWAMLAVVVLVIGGIYGGLFSPTEAGAVGAAGMFIIALALRKLNRQNVRDALMLTARTTSIIFIVGWDCFLHRLSLPERYQCSNDQYDRWYDYTNCWCGHHHYVYLSRLGLCP
jgi:TRAP-type C4-dicarboxylate transport system permease large subunit